MNHKVCVRGLSALLLSVMVGSMPGRALAYLALPGSTWGEVTSDTDGFEGLASQGFVNQGIDWVRLPGKLTLNTSAEMDWQFRTHRTPFYNVYGPQLSIDLRRDFYRFGVEYTHRIFPELHQTTDKIRPFLTWYKNWLAGTSSRVLGVPILGYPGDTWGRFAYSTDGLEGLMNQGYVNQGIRWDVLPRGFFLDSFAEYRWRIRTENKSNYDAHGPALGISVRWTDFRAGVEYYWQFLPELHQQNDHVLFFLNWYVDWDLKQIHKHP